MNATHFHYEKSYKIAYMGCYFHSLLELKFVLSLGDSWRFLREFIKIHYDPKTLEPTQYLQETTRFYTPDFLIRNKIDNKAFLVEIKPRAFDNERNLQVRHAVAEKYIIKHNLDWIYKVVYDDEIHLDDEQRQKFAVFAKHKRSFSSIFDLQELDRKLNSKPVNYFGCVPNFQEENISRKEYKRIVISGDRPT